MWVSRSLSRVGARAYELNLVAVGGEVCAISSKNMTLNRPAGILA